MVWCHRPTSCTNQWWPSSPMRHWATTSWPFWCWNTLRRQITSNRWRSIQVRTDPRGMILKIGVISVLKNNKQTTKFEIFTCPKINQARHWIFCNTSQRPYGGCITDTNYKPQRIHWYRMIKSHIIILVSLFQRFSYDKSPRTNYIFVRNTYSALSISRGIFFCNKLRKHTP